MGNSTHRPLDGCLEPEETRHAAGDVDDTELLQAVSSLGILNVTAPRHPDRRWSFDEPRSSTGPSLPRYNASEVQQSNQRLRTGVFSLGEAGPCRVAEWSDWNPSISEPFFPDSPSSAKPPQKACGRSMSPHGVGTHPRKDKAEGSQTLNSQAACWRAGALSTSSLNSAVCNRGELPLLLGTAWSTAPTASHRMSLKVLMQRALPTKLILAALGLRGACRCSHTAASLRRNLAPLFQLLFPAVLCIVNLANEVDLLPLRECFPKGKPMSKLADMATISTFRLIDVSHDSTRLVSIPVRARCHVTAVASVGSLVFLMGSAAAGETGCSSNGCHLLDRFDNETRTWEPMPHLPTLRQDYSATYIEGNIYVCGGCEGRFNCETRCWDSEAAVDTVERFNCETRCWDTLPPMLSKRAGAAAACVDGSLVIIGGSADGCALPSLERYTPRTGTWEMLPPMPTARTKCAAVVLKGQLYVLGGSDPESGMVLGSAERFEPMTGTWEVLPHLKEPRASLGAAAVRSQILAMGGDSAAAKGPSWRPPEVETLDIDHLSEGWIEGPELPLPVAHALSASSVQVPCELRNLWAADV